MIRRKDKGKSGEKGTIRLAKERRVIIVKQGGDRKLYPAPKDSRKNAALKFRNKKKKKQGEDKNSNGAGTRGIGDGVEESTSSSSEQRNDRKEARGSGWCPG